MYQFDEVEVERPPGYPETTEIICLDCDFTFKQTIKYTKERFGYMKATMIYPGCPKCHLKEFGRLL